MRPWRLNKMKKSELKIKQGNIKMFVFNEFPFEELNKIVKAVTDLGYSAIMLEDGRIIFNKED